MTMVNPGEGVKRNVTMFQLRGIIELAKTGYYGTDSAAILERSVKKLSALDNPKPTA